MPEAASTRVEGPQFLIAVNGYRPQAESPVDDEFNSSGVWAEPVRQQQQSGGTEFVYFGDATQRNIAAGPIGEEERIEPLMHAGTDHSRHDKVEAKLERRQFHGQNFHVRLEPRL